MKVMTEDLKNEYQKIKGLKINSLREDEPLFWLIHPEIDREKPKETWIKFFEEMKEEKGKIMLGLSKLISEKLENYLKEFEEREKIYLGGFKGKGISYLHKREFPDHEHYVLGWRIGYCMDTQVNYLLESGIPKDKIKVLEEYSFCCGKRPCVEESLQNYKENGIEVYSGSVKDLLENESL